MKAVELALKAARKRQSEITRFVHYCYENPDKELEAIPVYENFCFALALLRSKIADQVLEAKALLEKLLAFEVNGQFPVYLHEFPLCKYAGLGSKLSPVIYFILRDFNTILGDSLKGKLSKLLSRYCLDTDLSAKTPDQWAEFLIRAQITGEDKTPALAFWDPHCLAYIGHQHYERGEPAVTLYDLFLGEWGGRFSARALQDHPIHLKASLIYPSEAALSSPPQTRTLQFWGSGGPTHSLMIDTSGINLEGKIALPEKEVQEEVEIACFCNLHPDTEIFINHQKASAFQLGDRVQIHSKDKKFEISFHLEAGEGQFWGHLYRGNRPGQLACRGADKHEAFDWVVGLRTVKRGPEAVIRLEIQ